MGGGGGGGVGVLGGCALGGVHGGYCVCGVVWDEYLGGSIFCDF